MTRIVWDALSERYFEAGVDRGVLYVEGEDGVPWNGLVNVTEREIGGEVSPSYIDGVKQRNDYNNPDSDFTIDAFTYPDIFVLCEGQGSDGNGLFFTSQPKKPFGLTYRTGVGDGLVGIDLGYKIHFVYNATATPSDRIRSTRGTSPAPLMFNWTISTIPELVTEHRQTAHFIVDSRYSDPFLLGALEDILYGTETQAPRLPSVNELREFMKEWVTLLITDNGDGTFTASGPDEVVRMIGPDEFMISWSSVIMLDAVEYQVSSL